MDGTLGFSFHSHKAPPGAKMSLQDAERAWQAMLHRPVAELLQNKEWVLLVAQAWIYDPENPNFLLKKVKGLRWLLLQLVKQLLNLDPQRFNAAMKRYGLSRQGGDNPYLLLTD